ncbi:caspase [Drosophila grimshawi]|uniref:GH19956 n=1 Tax=Drosophila grimshawi TaxID=7222 RepID=B4JRJ9_DROGR|nr:caspase [Drosophila grimshawi]EDV94389.1 GH19956 [Drosophila grimshawi]
MAANNNSSSNNDLKSVDQVGIRVEVATNTDDTTDAFGSLGTGSSSTTTTTSASTSTYHKSTYGTGAIGQLALNGYSTSSNYQKNVAKMVTDRHAAEYNMRHKHRGMALIFNHEHFEVPTLKSRAGTNVDCENLTRVLKQLDFDVTTYKDYRYQEILSTVKYAAAQKHDDNDCILVAILSHGEMGYIYAKDTQYKLDNIWSHFTANHCPSLAGKPKLFFIQACQGDRLDTGVTMERGRTETDGDSTMSYKIPIHADFLIAYSTIPGFYSWRNTTRGSWFMQSLCAELAANGKRLDMLTLLTFVCQRVAVDFESCTPDTPEMHQQKQIPCITTMLTRILLFSDKGKVPAAGRN